MTLTSPLVLILAGSDSCGGAGVQADQRTVNAFGLRAATALTALTAQNPDEVRGIVEISPEFVILQARTVLDHEPAAAVKTGMLASAAIIDAVATLLADQASRPPVVVDPVMVATSGARLLSEDAVALLRARLLPLADVLTPNLHEAAVLLGEEPGDAPGWSRQRQAEAARAILAMGPRAVLVKGGHREDGASDVLATGRSLAWLEAPRIAASSTHGTGCTLAAGIAAGLALGQDVALAVRRAKEHLSRALAAGLDRPLTADFTGRPAVRVVEESA